jgi:hypothetical protein
LFFVSVERLENQHETQDAENDDLRDAGKGLEILRDLVEHLPAPQELSGDSITSELVLTRAVARRGVASGPRPRHRTAAFEFFHYFSHTMYRVFVPC